MKTISIQVREYVQSSLTGRSKADLHEKFNNGIMRDVYKLAENKQEGYYLDRYFNSITGQEYYRVKSNINL